GMRTVVRRDDAHVVHRLVQQRHVAFVLNDLHGIEARGLIERARHSGKMTAGLGIFVVAPLPVLPLRGRLRRVLVLRPRWRPAWGCTATAGATGAARGGEVRAVERADEESLEP